MSKIRALIVDDEPFARERVRRLLSAEPDIEIIGEAGDGASAIEKIKDYKPDLLFLDVQMPGKNGFEVLENLEPEETPVFIFLTAFDQYAVRAFESAALDYLLKPFDEERFFKAVNRAKAQLIQKESAVSNTAQTEVAETASSEIFGINGGYLERVLVKRGGRVYFFKTDEIDWIEAYGNYVRLNFDKTSYLMRETISSLEAKLDPKKFLRIHRSILINCERIREIQPLLGGRAKVVLSKGVQLTISRRYRHKLAKFLEK